MFDFLDFFFKQKKTKEIFLFKILFKKKKFLKISKEKFFYFFLGSTERKNFSLEF
jgi:hypothetical protein